MDRAKPLSIALLAGAAAFVWQAATVRANYGGNWSALYCTGAERGVSAKLAGEDVYRFAGSHGYDGQFYHVIAHDPLLRDPELVRTVDAPRLRYRRILIPGVAYLLALGQDRWVDAAYLALILASVAAGAYWGGLAFLALPASMVAVDRLTPDVALAAFAVALATRERSTAGTIVLLAAAGLVRETGLVLVVAYAAARGWRFGLAALPALGWYAFVHSRTAAYDYGTSAMPLASIARAFVHPAAYPDGTPLLALVRVGDFAALAGVVLAFGLALAAVRRDRSFPTLAAAGFALMGCLLQRDDHWLHVYDFGRVYSPLLALLAWQAHGERRWIWLAPWALMVPRVAMQLAPQALGIIRAAAG